ncbi:MAG TPA: phosphate signaling complex protein PhoU [Longimicrobiales bacterium]
MNPPRHFQDELDELKSRVVALAGRAEEAVGLAVGALLGRDRSKAEKVIRMDREIDELELEIDDFAIQLLALQQPMARDLRLITTALSITTDLERIGDHAVNIAQAVEYMLGSAPLPPLPEIEEMVRIANRMLGDALDAFVRGDAALARDVLRRDDRVDELHQNVFRILLTHMMEDPRRISTGMDLYIVSGNLERIADLATNIAEEVVFLVEGRTIKHHAEQRRAGEVAPEQER